MCKRFVLMAVLFASTTLAAADPVAPRFDVLHNADLYKQDSAKNTLLSIVGALERDRYDYVAAHLLETVFVDARLQASQAYFEKVAAEQIAATAAGSRLSASELPIRVREKAMLLNFQNLTATLKKKLDDEPDTVKWLKRFAREGEFNETGDTATATMKAAKDRAIYFKKKDGRWFMENRKEETKPAKE